MHIEMPTAPEFARQNALKAKKCLQKGSSAMLRTGKRRMNQLINKENLGEISLTKMHQFRRHQKNAEYQGDICKDNGAVAWLGWGNGYQGKKPIANASDWAAKQLKKSYN